MSEQDWLTSTDPAAMLQYVIKDRHPRSHGPSDRKLRLFACACCRQVWHLLTDERSRRAVKVAERFADGELATAETDVVQDSALEAWRATEHSFEAELAARCLGGISMLTENAGLPRWFSVSGKLKKEQAALLRGIIGNPWRPASILWKEGTAYKHTGSLNHLKMPHGCTLILDHEMYNVCRWLTPTVVSLATAAYEERPGRVQTMCGCGEPYTVEKHDRCPGGLRKSRIEDGTLDNARLAVLADALSDAGCVEETILTHLRSDEPHVRGCWVLDLLLGKE